MRLLTGVEAMIEYLLDSEPERMDRKGMVEVYLAAYELRCEIEGLPTSAARDNVAGSV